MKVNALLVTNLKELDKHEEMGIEWKPNYEPHPFLFNIKDVDCAFIDAEGNINVYLGGFEDEYQIKLEYTKELWNKLEAKFYES